jgi:molybdopterin-guanine dinucleotide biosynthesis protein B
MFGAAMKVFGFTGYSGSGKTTLIERLIPHFIAMGFSVSLIKHTHGGFDIDRPGKDSWRFRAAGAAEVMLVTDERWVLMHESHGAGEPSLDAQLARLSPCDLVLVEGYKTTHIAKIEVHRPDTGKALIWPQPLNIVALATDVVSQMASHVTPLPVFALNDIEAIAAFILQTPDYTPC